MECSLWTPRGRDDYQQGRLSDSGNRSDPPYPNLPELSEKHRALVGLIRKALDARQYVQDEDSVFVNSRNELIVLRTSISEQVDETGQRVGIVVLVKMCPNWWPWRTSCARKTG